MYTWLIANKESDQVIVLNETGTDLVHYSIIFPVTGMFVVSVSGENLMRATLVITVIGRHCKSTICDDQFLFEYAMFTW